MELLNKLKEKYSQLSKGQKAVGKYLMEKPEEFALQSAGQIGKQIGVSETTVIRFCYSLELSGYVSLQSIIREHFIHEKSSMDRYYSSKLEMAEQPHLFAQVMEKDMKNIQKAITNIREEDVQLAVEKIMDADTVQVTGMRTSFAPAQWFSFVLGLVRDEVKLFQPGTDDLFTALQSVNEQSVFIAVTFHRYVKETVKMAEMAKEQGAFVISMTDSALAPISEFSDITFAVGTGEDSTLDAFPPLFSFLNAMTASISVQYSEQIKERQKKYERMNAHHLFY
ncbi:SIS domain-containing protein [Bacillus aerolatus]|uniref:SIS domain-containing protein n=1 Tax=Bacillus aerolatus TaxID=2653354 RepID=A0A6I1FIG3_9BACI|nr:MurR/RpiR family transcriptional regulator [Bacillus aerolatus]KAB7705554.1 SIS domain-containing protein [Bacillus aerolatus]